MILKSILEASMIWHFKNQNIHSETGGQIKTQDFGFKI
jgi:hypothetical protein